MDPKMGKPLLMTAHIPDKPYIEVSARLAALLETLRPQSKPQPKRRKRAPLIKGASK